MKQKLFPYYLSIALALVLILVGTFQLRNTNFSLAEFSHPVLAFFGLTMGEDEEDDGGDEGDGEDEEDDSGDEGDGEEDDGDGEDDGGDEGDGGEDDGDDDIDGGDEGDGGEDDGDDDIDGGDEGDGGEDNGDGEDDGGDEGDGGEDDGDDDIDGGDNKGPFYCNRCSSSTSGGKITYYCSSEKFANSCSDNCKSAADCGGSDEPPGDDENGDNDIGGGDGGGDNTDNGDGQHKECVGVMYGYTSYCRLLSGNGADQCSCHEDCQATNPPDKNHTECRGDACVLVDGGGINQCTYYTDCANDSKVNNFVGFVINNTQQIYTTIVTTIQGAWMGFMGFLF